MFACFWASKHREVNQCCFIDHVHQNIRICISCANMPRLMNQDLQLQWIPSATQVKSLGKGTECHEIPC